MKQKRKHLFIPFLAALFGLTIGYTFLHWLLVIEEQLFSLKSVNIVALIPMVLAASVLWYLWAEIKKLRFKNKITWWHDIYAVVAWLLLITPSIIAQDYIIAATGKLTPLDSIAEIDQHPPTKYYTFKSLFIDKTDFSIYATSEIEGLYNQDFEMKIYYALPIFQSARDTVNGKPKAWLGISYYKTMTNYENEGDKAKISQKLIKQSWRDYKNQKVAAFEYLKRLENSDLRDSFLEAIKKSHYQPNGTVLVGVNKPFEARTGHQLGWIIALLVLSPLMWWCMLKKPGFEQTV